MSHPPLIDIGRLKRAALPEMDSNRDDVLELAIMSATHDILTMISPRQIIDPGSGLEWVELYDGDRCAGRVYEELYLRSFPAIEVVSVVENGVALTVGTGYSTSLDVLVEKDRGVLRRRGGMSPLPAYSLAGAYWSPGRQNIAVTYRGGFDPADVPGDLQSLCVFLATKHFQDPLKVDKETVSRPSGSTSYSIADLPAPYSGIVHRYMAHGRPRCWSGS